MDEGLGKTRRALETEGPVALAIDDLRPDDLAALGWSGTAAHVRSVADYLARVPSGEVEYLIARGVDGTPVAKGGILYGEVPGVAEIMQLATHGDLQGLGLGTALIAAAEERIRRRGVAVARVGVEDGNPRARALYERLGYRESGRREVSWEAEVADGSLFDYHTTITELDKAMTAEFSIRPVDWSRDEAGILAIPTAWIADRALALKQDDLAFSLVERPLGFSYDKDGSSLEQRLGGLKSSDAVFVAEIGSQIIGVAAMVVSQWNFRPGLAYLRVEPAWRRRGVATALVGAVLEAARASGARGLWLETTNVNIPAINLYRKLGFELCGLDRSLYMRWGLDGEVALYFLRRFDGEARVQTPDPGGQSHE